MREVRPWRGGREASLGQWVSEKERVAKGQAAERCGYERKTRGKGQSPMEGRQGGRRQPGRKESRECRGGHTGWRPTGELGGGWHQSGNQH